MEVWNRGNWWAWSINEDQREGAASLLGEELWGLEDICSEI